MAAIAYLNIRTLKFFKALYYALAISALAIPYGIEVLLHKCGWHRPERVKHLAEKWKQDMEQNQADSESGQQGENNKVSFLFTGGCPGKNNLKQ